jgi:putative chitinase
VVGEGFLVICQGQAVTPETLRAAFGCSLALANEYAPLLQTACEMYEITTPMRLAAFLAQIGHESGSFRYTEEIWGPTPTQLRYEGRKDLGNTAPGDGFRYRGRGLIQTTGRSNYRALTKRLRERLGDGAPDFEADPDSLREAWWAAVSAADYWDMRGLNSLADSEGFVQVGRAINRGDPKSSLPANGEADRLRRWELAKTALSVTGTSSSAPAPAPETPVQQPSKERIIMPIPAILGALLPSLISSIPVLGKLFGSGSDVAERNVKAATMVMQIAQDALNTRSAQEAVELVAASPEAAAKVREAVEAKWLELTESGGDGIAGARKAEVAFIAFGEPVWKSPSFLVGCLMLPLVYMVIANIVGILGPPLSDEVRSTIAGSTVSLILGGLIGYYYGQTTSRNRTPAQ